MAMMYKDGSGNVIEVPIGAFDCWSGTREEYEAQKDDIGDGTYVNITDENLGAIDEALDTASKNPVQNKAVTSALNELSSRIPSSLEAQYIPYDDTNTKLGADDVQNVIKILALKEGLGLIYKATLKAGLTEVTVTGMNIQNGDALQYYTSVAGLAPTNVVIENTKVTFTFPAQENDILVGVEVK